jgi:eukaryotic-like serine/threonine-protein kinase
VEVDLEQLPMLSRLLDEALAIPEGARERWLESLPPADIAMKTKLRALLQQAASAETGDFVDILPKLPVAAAVASGEAVLQPGATVGAYVIEQEIGRGGMGAVWRARRSDGVIKRPVALKLPHAGLYCRELLKRSASERDILGALSHANIARLYDAGFTEAGQPFLALEYVDGVPLTNYCDQHCLDVPARLRLFQQVLCAVQYAHANLVIHRDLKPSNVLVGPEGRAMLLDFGIAKLMAPDAAESGARTQLGLGPLTPDYASPEQISGAPITTAADVYSLGVLLFELLTGDRPYRLEQRSRGALEAAILSTDAPRPSRSVRDEPVAAARGTTAKALSRMLRGDLDTIILKALKKMPADRYATADAFSQDVERYLAGQPLAARPDSGWYRVRKFIARHKLAVATGVVAFTAVIVTAAVALFEAHAAAAARDRALALSARNEAVVEFLSVLITEAAGSDKPVTVSDMLARSEGLVRKGYQDHPIERAAVLDALARYYVTSGQEARGATLLDEALETVKGSADADLLRQLTCDQASAIASQGQVSRAERQLKNVIADPQASALQAAECLEYLSFIAQYANDADQALMYAEQALQRLHQVERPPPTLEGTFLGSVGYAHHLRGRNDLAVQFFDQALAHFERMGRERGPDAISVRNNAAVARGAAGDVRRSLELYDQTLQIVAQTDPGAPLPPYLLGNRSRVLEDLGRYAEARDGFLRCVAPTGKAPNLVSQAYCLTGLASVSLSLGDLAAGKSALAAAAGFVGNPPEPGAPEVVALQTLRARVAMAEQQFAEARANLDAAITTGKSLPQLHTALLIRAELNLQKGDAAGAEADARRALSIARTLQGSLPYSNNTGLAWLALGEALATRADAAGARRAFHSAVAQLSHTVDEGHPMLQRARELERG